MHVVVILPIICFFDYFLTFLKTMLGKEPYFTFYMF